MCAVLDRPTPPEDEGEGRLWDASEPGSSGLRVSGEPVIVWLWDTDGPDGSASGITGDHAAARRAAEEGMTATGAAAAVVEVAVHFDGGGWMSSGYRRTGHRWAARRHDDLVTWTETRRSGGLAAS